MTPDHQHNHDSDPRTSGTPERNGSPPAAAPPGGAHLPILRSLAWGAGAYCLLITALLLFFTVREGRDRWLENDELKNLRAQLQKTPENTDLKKRIRVLDARLRRRFWTYRKRREIGGWLLLAGAAVWLGSLVALHGVERDPHPTLPPSPEELAAQQKRLRTRTLRISGAAAGVFVLAALAGWFSARRQAAARSGAAGRKQVGSAFGTAAWFANWPQFRGPYGSGLAGNGPWPVDWNAATGANIAWSVELPADAPGNSSPVVWNDRLFLTGATAEAEFVLCFSTTDGRLLWKQQVHVERANPNAFRDLEVMEATGWAAPTPVTDGRYLAATFATADIAAFDFDGNQTWGWNAGLPDSAYGLASSLVLVGDRVIWQLDQGQEAGDAKSALHAIDIATGKVVWRTPRPVPNSWSTPVALPVSGTFQIVAAGNPWVIGYDSDGGLEVWRARLLDGDIGPSPTWHDAVVYVAQSGAQAAAIRCDGHGDVTKTHVLWTSDDGLPDTASPATDGNLFIQAGTDGLVTCSDAATGKLLWEHQYDFGFEASPVIAGDRIYLWSDDGSAVILAASPEFREIAVRKIGEPVRATPAFVKGRVYVRTKTRLLCIGASPAGP